MAKGKDVVKKLAKIAAKEIQNIRESVFPNVYDIYEKADIAYGAALYEDFTNWLLECKSKGKIPTYPVGDYLRIIENRLKPPSMIGTERVNYIPGVKEANPQTDKKVKDIIALYETEKQKQTDFEKKRIDNEEMEMESLRKNPNEF